MGPRQADRFGSRCTLGSWPLPLLSDHSEDSAATTRTASDDDDADVSDHTENTEWTCQDCFSDNAAGTDVCDLCGAERVCPVEPPVRTGTLRLALSSPTGRRLEAPKGFACFVGCPRFLIAIPGIQISQTLVSTGVKATWYPGAEEKWSCGSTKNGMKISTKRWQRQPPVVDQLYHATPTQRCRSKEVCGGAPLRADDVGDVCGELP